MRGLLNFKIINRNKINGEQKNVNKKYILSNGFKDGTTRYYTFRSIYLKWVATY